MPTKRQAFFVARDAVEKIHQATDALIGTMDPGAPPGVIAERWNHAEQLIAKALKLVKQQRSEEAEEKLNSLIASGSFHSDDPGIMKAAYDRMDLSIAFRKG